jgi:OOP family OmpA-OmpF porin
MRKRINSYFIALLVFTVLAGMGCGQKETVKPEPEAVKPVEKVVAPVVVEEAPKKEEQKFESTPVNIAAIKFENVLFDREKSTLKSGAVTALTEVVRILKENPHINIEVSGHADSRGQDSLNQRLSEMRAKAVADYLVNNGINRNRISQVWHSSKFPVASNDTASGRALNRRVEIKITSK